VARDSRDPADQTDRLELPDLLDQLVERDGPEHLAKLDLPDSKGYLDKPEIRETLDALVIAACRDFLETLEPQELQGLLEELEVLVHKVREAGRARTDLKVSVGEMEHQEHQVRNRFYSTYCLY